MAEITYLKAINQALHEEMRRDEDVLVLGEDVAELGGAFKATEGLLDAFGRDRVVDTPIAEELIVGAGVGLAVSGLRPVVEMQFIDFISCGFDQVVNMAATLRYRHGGRASCPLVVRGPAGSGVHGGLFHSQNPEAWFCHVPGLKVVAPATVRDAKGLLKAAIRDDDPVIVLEHKGLYRTLKEDLGDEEIVIPIGKAVTRRPGRDLLIVAYGGAVPMAMAAAERLAAEGIEAEVLDLRTVHPIDWDAVYEGVGRLSRVLIAHEARLSFGVGAEVAARIAEHAFDLLDAPVARVAAADTHNPFSPPLEEWVLPSADKIAARARELVRY
jgi:2-oxoisovalerate dehydrogenase E1 component beta subunit